MKLNPFEKPKKRKKPSILKNTLGAIAVSTALGGQSAEQTLVSFDEADNGNAITLSEDMDAQKNDGDTVHYENIESLGPDLEKELVVLRQELEALNTEIGGSGIHVTLEQKTDGEGNDHWDWYLIISNTMLLLKLGGTEALKKIGNKLSLMIGKSIKKKMIENDAFDLSIKIKGEDIELRDMILGTPHEITPKEEADIREKHEEFKMDMIEALKPLGDLISQEDIDKIIQKDLHDRIIHHFNT